MKDTWVLTVRTSLPKACENAYGLKLDVYAFESFQEERDRLRQSLLAYCGLDTLAMVMLWQRLREFCHN